jgi:hypothetical protein
MRHRAADLNSVPVSVIFRLKLLSRRVLSYLAGFFKMQVSRLYGQKITEKKKKGKRIVRELVK